MNDNLKDTFARLSAPFHPDDIEWRAGATNADKSRALALAYITSRAVMDRLDDVVGPENWKDEYAPGPQGGVICGLSLRVLDEWITKWDGAENTDFEAIKGGLSDAFKRAGYKWGIGRYLYRLESSWVDCEAHGKSIVLKSTPPLPQWALPDVWVAPSGAIPAQKPAAAILSPKEREQKILQELGFEVDKPLAEPVPFMAAPVSPAPTVSGGNGSNGNGSNGNGAAPKPQPTTNTKPTNGNGKRPTSWTAAVVQAVMKAKLANTSVEAVRLLNQSGLDGSTTPAQAVARIQSMRQG